MLQQSSITITRDQHAFMGLYYLLTVDEKGVNSKELGVGKRMLKDIGLEEEDIRELILEIISTPADKLYRECVETLKRLDVQLQARCVAWLCLVANSDGFMEKQEWQFIYTLYANDLKLDLGKIMLVQKELQ